MPSLKDYEIFQLAFCLSKALQNGFDRLKHIHEKASNKIQGIIAIATKMNCYGTPISPA